MAVRARTAGVIGLVLAGVVVAAGIGQLPAIGSPTTAVTETPSAAAQRLICPGAAVAIGVNGGSASALSAVGTPTRSYSTTKHRTVASASLGRTAVKGAKKAAPSSLTASAAAGVLAAAQSQTVTTGDATGLAATGCAVPGTSSWLTAGATTTGRTSVLLLANPTGVAATVTISVWTASGPVAQTTTVAVPAKRGRAVSVAGLAPNASGVAIHVASVGGLIAAALEQRTVRGLESGGIDIVGASAAPAVRQRIPGVRVANAAAVAAAATADDSADLATVVRVLVPGRRGADVTITAQGATGSTGTTSGAAVTRHIDAGHVVDVPLTGLTTGTYAVTVASSAPVVAAARTSVVGEVTAGSTSSDSVPTTSAETAGGTDGTSGGTDGGTDGATDGATDGTDASGSSTPVSESQSGLADSRSIDFAWFASAETLPATSAVAVAAGTAPVLTITNPTRASSTVTLSGAVDSSVTVPAGQSVSVSMQRGLTALRGTKGLVAAVSYADTAAIAGYPVAPPASAATPVRVTD